MDPSEQKESGTPSRRQFLKSSAKLAGGAAATVVVSQLPTPETLHIPSQEEQREHLRQLQQEGHPIAGLIHESPSGGFTTGFVKATEEEIAQFNSLTAEQLSRLTEIEIPQKVDLRDQLGPTILQLYNDCVPSALCVLSQKPLSPAFTYLQRPSKQSGDNGTTIPAMLQVIVNKGNVLTIDMPYTPDIDVVNDEPTQEQFVKAATNKIDKNSILNIYSGYLARPKDQQLCRLISEKGSLIASATIYFPNWDVKGNEVVTEPDQTTNIYFSHTFVICGYDLPNRLFYVKNSWGNTFGNNGVATVSFDALGGGRLQEVWGIQKPESQKIKKFIPQQLVKATY